MNRHNATPVSNLSDGKVDSYMSARTDETRVLAYRSKMVELVLEHDLLQPDEHTVEAKIRAELDARALLIAVSEHLWPARIQEILFLQLLLITLNPTYDEVLI
jgi:hypothetical protein